MAANSVIAGGRTRRWTLVVAACVALGLLASSVRAVEPQEVGRYSCPDRLEVVGTKEVSAAALVRALAGDSEIVWAGHPHAVMSLYRDTIRRRTILALQHLGFPDAQVTTRLDLENEKVIVEVDEGRSYSTGVIRVGGASPELARHIADALRLSYPPEGAVPAPPGAGSNVPASRWVDQDGLPVKMRTPKWKPGTPAAWDPPTQAAIIRQVGRALEAQGRDNAKYTVEWTRDATRGAANLLVTVADEGSPGRVASVVVRGGPRDSREDVLTYLDLKVGQPLTRLDAQNLEYRLRASGRFTQQRVTTRRVGRGDDVEVTIELREYPPATALAQPLTAEEQALLACRAWFLRMGESGYELKIEGPQGEFHWSAQGLLFHTAGTTRERITWVLTAGQVGCYLPDGQGRLVVPVSSRAHMTTSLNFALNEHAGQKDAAADLRPFSLNLNAGVRTDEPESTEPPLQLVVSGDPVFFLAAAHEYQPRFTWTDKVLTIVTENGQARVDTTDGRLLELTSRHSEGTKFRVTSVRNELGAHLKELNARSGSNRYDPSRPISSVAEFGGSPAILTWVRTQLPPLDDRSDSSLVVAAVGVLARLAQDNALRPLDQWAARQWDLPQSEARHDTIEIPLTEEEQARQTPVRQLATLALQLTDVLFDRDTWAATLGRVAASLAAGEYKYFAHDSLALYQSEDMGPIGCLMIAAFAPIPTAEARFSQKGAERLSLDYFRRDSQLLIAALERTHCLESTVAVARVITPEQAGAIGRLVLSDERGAVEMIRFLRSQPSNAAAVASLPKALDLLWESGLKKRIADALQSHDPELAARPRVKN